MRYLCRRLLAKWGQYRTETALLVAGFLGLIVNLACLGRFLSPAENRIIVIVDSQREAALLWLLKHATVIPGCKVHVIRRTGEFHELAEQSASEETLLVATSRLYSKHYQAMVDLRRRLRLIVL